MKHHYLRWFLSLVAASAMTPVSAQITLHEATNVTQTKATLSADFPDLSVEHGFQYKYGTLPEIDDFSRTALAANSDPVQLNSSTVNKWICRTNYGWIESPSSLPAGAATSIKCTVNIYKPSTINFEWSVDSEENKGILSFIVDGKIIESISGEKSFELFSFNIEAGNHSFEWKYSKASNSNAGLDVAMLKNIFFENTISGEWESINCLSDKMCINDLIPQHTIIFRAFDSKNRYSNISVFSTDSIKIHTPIISKINTASVNIVNDFYLGDASCKKYFVYGIPNIIENSQEAEILLNNSSPKIELDCNNFNILYSHYLSSPSDKTSSVEANVFVVSKSEVSFEFRDLFSQGGNHGIHVLVDGKRIIHHTSDMGDSGMLKFSIEHGFHSFSIILGNYSTSTGSISIDRGQTRGWIYNLIINNVLNITESQMYSVEDLSNSDSTIFNIRNLKPNTNYVGYSLAEVINHDSVRVYSNPITFTTEQVKLIPKYVNSTHTSISIDMLSKIGDAQIETMGLSYKDATSTTWSNFPIEPNTDSTRIIISRLKPNTKYQIKSYIKPSGCDYTYSTIQSFPTKKIEALPPIFSDIHQQSVKILYPFSFTDAKIYSKGAKFREVGSEEWIDLKLIELTNDTCYVELEDLKVGKFYETYSYILPMGGDEIKSSIIKFKTLSYFTSSPIILHLSPTSVSLKIDVSFENGELPQDITFTLNNEVKTGIEFNSSSYIYNCLNLLPSTSYLGYFSISLSDGTNYDSEPVRFTTPAVNANVKIYNITQTKAEMDIAIDAGGDAEITNLRYMLDYGEWQSCSSNVKINGLTPGSKHYIQIGYTLNDKEYILDEYNFTTKSVSAYVYFADIQQTSASITAGASYGDATLVAQGYEVAGVTYDNSKGGTVTELMPDTKYTCRSYVETKEGGRVYSTSKDFTTKSIYCYTRPVTCLSNRSATLNGSIDCDANSSAEFGFQWKKMTGWNSDPAFTKGHKLDDGTISVALVNGMLDPDTDYQYRAAVRYKNKIYYGPWETFRTEAEYVYYPASVYTVFRTDRENNSLVLCGYYIAGSEAIVSQGYEYWKKNPGAIHPLAAQSPAILTTDESMQHIFAPGELPAGDYSVRAFVKTESGETIYGPTLGFTASNSGYSEVEEIPCDTPSIKVESSIVKIYNAAGLDCIIARINGVVVASRTIVNDYEELTLTPGYYIVKLSNGLIEKIRL